jgi:hypothetical protein
MRWTAVKNVNCSLARATLCADNTALQNLKVIFSQKPIAKSRRLTAVLTSTAVVFTLLLPGRNYGWPVITQGKNYGGGKSVRASASVPAWSSLCTTVRHPSHRRAWLS